MIAGTIIGGIRSRDAGPSRARTLVRERARPISDPLPNPVLMLVDSQGTTLFYQ